MKKTTLRRATLVCALSLCAITGLFAQNEHDHGNHDEFSGKRILLKNPTKDQLVNVAELGLDLHCGAKPIGNDLRLDVYGNALEEISALGLNYEIVEEDLSTFYARRGQERLPLAIQQLEALKVNSQGQNRSFSELEASIDNPIQYDECAEFNWVPQNFQLGSMGGCLTVDEALAELDRMKLLFPDLISTKASASAGGMQTNGNTTGSGTTSSGIPIDFDPQDIFYVRISDNPETDEANEPESLITGMIHAREASSLMNIIYYMWYILENYDQDPVIKNMIDNQELYFVPIINPDGLRWNEIVQDGNSGGGQRKNLRDGVNDNGSVSNGNVLRGIDLNRNSDYYWGFDEVGSSSLTNRDTYRGDSPGSENEIMIMQEFVDDHSFETAINHHAGLNSIVTTSYNGDPSASSGREDEFQNLMQNVTRYNRYVHGSAPNTLTNANGDINDWMFGGPVVNYNPIGPLTSNPSTGSGQGIITFSPENGDEFWPDPTEFVTIAQRAVRINLITSLTAGRFAKLYDHTESNIDAMSGQLDFAIEHIGQTYDNVPNRTTNFTLQVEAVSDNIVITTPSATALDNMDVLEQRSVSASYTLDAGIQANDPIQYKVTLSNDIHTIYEATFIKYYSPTVIITADGISNWSTTSWSETTDGFNGSTNAITSTATSYGNSNETFVTLTNPINLSSVSSAVIHYNAVWDIERNFDLAQLEASTDGGTTWVALCGRHTRPAATRATSFHLTKSSDEENFQSLNGAHIYDGDMYVDTTDDSVDNPTAKWVLEEVFIDATNNPSITGNSSVQFRFKFASDTSNRQDGYNVEFRGFKFDNFEIVNTSIDDRTCINGAIDTFPYRESFENGTGTFFQAGGDDGDWTINLATQGTPSGSTGPPSGVQSIHEQNYVYTEASTDGLGFDATVILQSNCIDFTSEYNDIDFAFNYHRFGSDFGVNNGTLDVQISDDQGDTWTNIVPQISGASVNAWQEVTEDLTAFSGKVVIIRFIAVTGDGFRSDLALDNIRITATKQDYIHRLVGGVPTWSPTDPSGVSGVNDDILVLSGSPTLTGNTTANDILINEGATLNIGSNTLTSTGDITNNGTLSASNATIIAQGTFSQTFSGNAFETAQLTVNAASTSLTLDTDVDINQLLTLSNGELVTNDNLTLSSSATQSAMIDQITSGTITGNVTIERFVPARRAFRFVTSPVTTTTTIRENWQENGSSDPDFGTHITGSTSGQNGFDTTPSGNPSLFTYDNSAVTPALTPIDNTDMNTLTAGDAYLLFVRGDRTIDVTSNSAVPTDTRLRASGAIVTGTSSITGGDLNHTAGGFNLVGNPYQATVDMNDIVANATNVNTNQYYVWDATLGARGAYVTVLLTGTGSTNGAGSEANHFFQPWQSAFVTTAATVGDNSTTVTFNESDKMVGEDTNIFFTEENPIIDNAHIIGQLFRTEDFNAGGKLQDNFVILFSPDFSNDITLTDAAKFFNIDENMAVSNGDDVLSVERRALPTIDEEIQLFNNAYRTDAYTLRVQQAGLTDVTSYLEDTFTGEIYELEEGDNFIEFTVDTAIEASIDSERFKIIFEQSALSTEDTFIDDISMFPNPLDGDQVQITSTLLQGQEVSIKINNVLGQIIYSEERSFNGNTLEISSLSTLTNGMYFVTITTETGSITKRLIKK
ncbi:M14 family zinc carboxypeptidase [Dokdonia sp.]|uniref:M14 family zinc carboxypeptidase n=1 Tax=Dokdonia sp. TaxID=2024995 RepID=UPI0032678F3B